MLVFHMNFQVYCKHFLLHIPIGIHKETQESIQHNLPQLIQYKYSLKRSRRNCFWTFNNTFNQIIITTILMLNSCRYIFSLYFDLWFYALFAFQMILICILVLMIQTKVPLEKQHHRNVLFSALKKAYQKTTTPYLYLQTRARQIITTLIPQSELFSSGFTKIMTQNNVPQQDIDNIVLVAVIGYQAISQLEKYWHLFNNITAINLNISGKQTKELIKVSPLRKKLKGFVEISLNFIPFIDSVYCTTPFQKEGPEDKNYSFQESLTSFLTSLPKFHEFQISLVKNSTAKSLGENIKSALQEKLSVLQSHQCPQFNSKSSPRIKVLVMQRKIDQMSPLLYSYYYGAIAEQMQVFKHVNKKYTSNSSLYKVLFPMDIKEASEKIQNLAQQKASNKKQKFDLHEFEKAKKIISNHYDESTTPEEIDIQIQAAKTVKEFCQRRLYNTILQQTIINARSQTDHKMTPGKVIDFVVQWSNIDISKFKPSKDDYTKIVILSYMVNSFWFWQRRILNAGLQQQSKSKIVNFCKKVQGKFKPLEEKPQGQQRFDLYRHEPIIVKQSKRWIGHQKDENYQNIEVNKSAINRQSKRIIAIKGPLGYGELSMLLRQLKSKQKTQDCVIFCECLITTKQYLKLILGEKISK